jgi:hypothetical protein
VNIHELPVSTGPRAVPARSGIDLGSVSRFCRALHLGECAASQDSSRSADNLWMHGVAREHDGLALSSCPATIRQTCYWRLS